MSFGEAQWDRGNDEESGGQIPPFLLDPVGVARRRWLPASLCLAAGIVATFVAVILWKAVFVASSTILVTSQEIPTEFVRSTVREDTLANVNAMMGEVLTAEKLTGMIEEHGLFAELGDVPKIDLVHSLRSRITANAQSGTNLARGNAEAIVYEIFYESGDPKEAATVANALAALFIDASVERRNSQAKRTTVFLRNALEDNEKELREQSRLVTEFRQAHRGELPDEHDTGLRRLELLSQQRESLSEQIASKEDRILSISSQGSEVSETQVLLNEMRRELAGQMAIHTDEHPNVIALRERLARLEEAQRDGPLGASTTRMIGEEQREIARLREQRDRVAAEVAELNQRLDRTPEIAEQLTALEQKETVLRDDYTDALRKVEEAELAENLESQRQGGQVTILDRAVPPSMPKLSRWVVLLAGLALSAGLTLGVAVLLELVDPVVVDARQVEQLSGSTVLGTVPYVA